MTFILERNLSEARNKGLGAIQLWRVAQLSEHRVRFIERDFAERNVPPDVSLVVFQIGSQRRTGGSAPPRGIRHEPQLIAAPEPGGLPRSQPQIPGEPRGRPAEGPRRSVAGFKSVSASC